MAIGRVIRLLFWVVMFTYGNVFWQLILADLLHLVLVWNFVKNNLHSVGKNRSFLLLS